MYRLLCFLFIIQFVIISCEEDSRRKVDITFDECHTLGTDTLSFSSASAQGVDSVKLDSAVNALTSIGYDPNSLSGIHSVVIVKNGFVIAEYYKQGSTASDPHFMNSATKSMTSLLAGIAIDRGYIENENVKLADYFPEYFNKNLQSGKFQITLKHLLTMSSGLEWFEGTTHLYGDDDIKAAIQQLPLVRTPGESWSYNSADLHLVSGVVTKATGKSLKEFGQEFLFGPMNIQPGSWISDKQGYSVGSSQLNLTPRDMAKIGMMVLNNGCYAGKKILSEDWISKIENPVFFPKGAAWLLNGYSYAWWVDTWHGYGVRLALGSALQSIVVIKNLNVVVVTTGLVSDSKFPELYGVIKNKVIPAFDPTIIDNSNP